MGMETSNNNDVSPLIDNRISEELLTQQELADRLKIHVVTVNRYVLRYKSFPRYKIGRHNRFYLSEVLDWFNRRDRYGSKTPNKRKV